MAYEGFAPYPSPVDQADRELVEKIVNKIKSQGIFDQFRQDCLADVDTKPAYKHLQERVNGSVSAFLKKNRWKSDLNKTQLRESLRHHVQQGYFHAGVDRIVDQVVNSKIYSVFVPKVEDMVYETLGIEKPKKPEKVKKIANPPAKAVSPVITSKKEEKPEEKTPEKPVEKQDEVQKAESSKKDVEISSEKAEGSVDLLPNDLDPVSPPSVVADDDRDDSDTIDETPFLLATIKSKDAPEASNASKLSGMSDLSSHGTVQEISSTTNSLKTPNKPILPKLDNFSNLSEKLKHFDPLSKATVPDKAKAVSEDDASSASILNESESNGKDSNVEFDRNLISEDSKSSITDFKKFKDKTEDQEDKNKTKNSTEENSEDKKKENTQNSENDDKNKKESSKKSSEKKSESRSRHDSDRKDSKSSSSRSRSKKDDKSRDKSKDDKYKSRDDRHRSERKSESDKKDESSKSDKKDERKSSSKHKDKRDDKKDERKKDEKKRDDKRRDDDKKKYEDKKKDDDKNKDEDKKKDDDKKKDEDRKRRDDDKRRDEKKRDDKRRDDEKRRDDDKKKDDEKSRKRRGERCSEKSKESRRSSDRDNSGGQSGKKPSSRSDRRSSSEKSTSKSSDQKPNGEGPQDSEISEVDMVLMKINSSIDLALKKPKIAKNIHEARKIDKQRRSLEDKKEHRNEKNDVQNIEKEKTEPSENEFNTGSCSVRLERIDYQEQNFEDKKETNENETKEFHTPVNEDKIDEFYGFKSEEIEKFEKETESKSNIWKIKKEEIYKSFFSVDESSKTKTDYEFDTNLNIKPSSLRKRKNSEESTLTEKKLRRRSQNSNSNEDEESENECCDSVDASSMTVMLDNLLKETDSSIINKKFDDDNVMTNQKTRLKSKNVEKAEPATEVACSVSNEKRSKARNSTRTLQQRYDNSDLYKPKSIGFSSRRSRALNDSSSKTDNVPPERKRAR